MKELLLKLCHNIVGICFFETQRQITAAVMETV